MEVICLETDTCIMVLFESTNSEIIVITGQRSCVERAQRMILHVVKMEKNSEREVISHVIELIRRGYFPDILAVHYTCVYE